MSIELAKAVLKNPNLIYDKKELEKFGFKDVVKAVTSLNFTFRDNKTGVKFLREPNNKYVLHDINSLKSRFGSSRAWEDVYKILIKKIDDPNNLLKSIILELNKVHNLDQIYLPVDLHSYLGFRNEKEMETGIIRLLKSFRLEGTNPVVEKGTFPVNGKNKTAFSFQIK